MMKHDSTSIDEPRPPVANNMGVDGKDDDDRRTRSLDEEWARTLQEQRDPFWTSLESERARLEGALRDDNIPNSPFSAFKQFIDSNLKQLTNGFKHTPSEIREFRAKMQREQDRMQEEELDISRRWTGSDDSPDHIFMEKLKSTTEECQDAMDATISLLAESERRNAHVPQEKIKALYKDDGFNFEQVEGWSFPGMSYTGHWLSVDWFKRNPYSPIRLEAHPDLAQYGFTWRAAFEDLMDAALDKPMGSIERVGMRTPYGKPQSTYHGPGLEWLLSLQCRGILPPLLPRSMNHGRSSNQLPKVPDGGSIVEAIRSAKEDLQWRPSLVGAPDWIKPHLYLDVADLVSEVATKATSEGEAEPIEYGNTPADGMHDNVALQDYQVRLLLEQPNNRWLLMAREDEDKSADVTGNQDAESSSGPQNAVRLEATPHGSTCLVPDEEEWGKGLSHLQDEGDRARAWLDSNVDLFTNQVQNGAFSVDEIVQKVERLLEEASALDLDLADDLAPYLQSLVMQRQAQEPRHADRAVQDVVGTDVQNKSEILSALTTTETTRLPDGTVTTKVVLKKRFADGREETSESVHTSKEELGRPSRGIKGGKEEPKKKGWFWS